MFFQIGGCFCKDFLLFSKGSKKIVEVNGFEILKFQTIPVLPEVVARVLEK